MGDCIQLQYCSEKSNERLCDKTNEIKCAQSEDSDPSGHLPSLISLGYPHEESPNLPNECTVKALIRIGKSPN